MSFCFCFFLIVWVFNPNHRQVEKLCLAGLGGAALPTAALEHSLHHPSLWRELQSRTQASPPHHRSCFLSIYIPNSEAPSFLGLSIWGLEQRSSSGAWLCWDFLVGAGVGKEGETRSDSGPSTFPLLTLSHFPNLRIHKTEDSHAWSSLISCSDPPDPGLVCASTGEMGAGGAGLRL